MTRKWILVAGTTNARLFNLDQTEELHPLENWADEGGKLKTHDLETDGEGSADVGVSKGHPDAQNHEHQKFTHQVATAVNSRIEDFDELIVVAADQTLGELRAGFNPEATRKVTQEIHKNWAQSTLHELPALLKKAMETAAK